MALPKSHRLRHRQDFSAVYRAGLRRSSSHLTLRALRSPSKDRESDCPTTLFGVSISQKVSKRAVVRNRIKRQITAALSQLLPALAEGWRVVIVVQPNATQCDYGQFLQELKQLLVDAEVFNGH